MIFVLSKAANDPALVLGSIEHPRRYLECVLARTCRSRQVIRLATFLLLHGAASSGWYWHLVQPLLELAGHQTVAPDLPPTTPTRAWPTT